MYGDVVENELKRRTELMDRRVTRTRTQSARDLFKLEATVSSSIELGPVISVAVPAPPSELRSPPAPLKSNDYGNGARRGGVGVGGLLGGLDEDGGEDEGEDEDVYLDVGEVPEALDVA